MFSWFLLAGACAAGGSTLGKLSGSLGSQVGGVGGWALSGALLGLMVCVNTAGCRYYVRALDASPSSTVPAVVSAALAYLLSGVSGIMLFDEWSSTTWWCGAALASLGLTLLASDPDPDSPSTRHNLRHQHAE